MGETSRSPTVSTKLERIAKLAKELRGAPLQTLAHYIDVEWLREAHRRTRKSGAPGVDATTAAQYGERLEDNLRALLDRVKAGRYRAPPVRRVHIPKGDGSQMRPIGIPTFEDKILQRAVAMVLEAVYEQEFHDFSYGFRPGRSALQACEVLDNKLMKMGGGWVLEVARIRHPPDLLRCLLGFVPGALLQQLRHRLRRARRPVTDQSGTRATT